MRPSSKMLLGVAVVLALGLFLALYLSAAKPTDRDQIASQMEAIRDAAHVRSVSGLMRVVSADYHDNELADNVDQAHVLLGRAMRNVQQADTSVNKSSIVVTGDTATSSVAVNATLRGGGSYQSTITLHWRRTPTHRLLVFPDTVWQVSSADYHATDLGED